MKSVYLSSTFEDLSAHRTAVYQGLRSMRYDVKAMEDYVAMDGPMVHAVMDDVGSCDIYVGIFAWRYGYIPPDANPDHLSITELEYRQAGAAKKPRLIFLLDPAAPWSPKFMDAGGENGNIQRLRKELATLMHSEFSTPEDLALKVQAAVHLAEVKARFQPLSGDIGNASCLTMMSSARPEIVANIRSAITEDVGSELIKLNLGAGREWWSTRLHLLSALCADYTGVRQMLFEGEGYRFLGICPPSHVRRALARAFPAIENAYRRAMVPAEESSGDLAAEVARIVDQYSVEMDRMGGEEQVMRWVDPSVITNWPGVNKARLDLPGGVITPAILQTIVKHPEPYVVLVKDAIVQQVVDRAALAARIALGDA